MSAAVAALIYDTGGKLLLTYRAHEPGKGKLDLPGGFVDSGEDANTALIREIMEELNLEVTDSKYSSSYPNEYIYGGIIYFTLDLVFVCQVASFEAISPADDVNGFIFMEPKSINLEDIGLHSVKSIIRSLQLL